MSKEIDLTQPLSAEDEAYVKDRPWLLEDAQLRGIEVTFESAEDSDETEGSESGQSTTGTDQTGITGEASTEGSESTDESDESDEDDEGLDESDDEDEIPPYSEWEYDDLKAELKNRELPTTGKREALVARLEEDDAK